MDTSYGFQSNWQIPRSLARVVTVDSEVAARPRKLYPLNVTAFVHLTQRSNYGSVNTDSITILKTEEKKYNLKIITRN